MIQHPTGPLALAAAALDGVFALRDSGWMTPAAFESAENLALIAAYEHRPPSQPRGFCDASSIAAMPQREPAPGNPGIGSRPLPSELVASEQVRRHHQQQSFATTGQQRVTACYFGQTLPA